MATIEQPIPGVAQRDTRLTFRQRTTLRHTLIHLFLLGGVVVMFIPLAWTLSTSLKWPGEVYIFPPTWIPKQILWSYYLKAVTTIPFFLYLWNTAYITLASIVGKVISITLVAFAFARLQWRGRDAVFLLMLSTMMLPFPVLLIPTYEIFNKLGMLNTLWPLFIRSFFGNAFLIFLLRQFFMSIPRELEEAAVIDGANTLQVLWSVILPLSKPALATIGIFTFWWNWNAFLEPFVYVNSVKNFTVSLGLAFFKGQYVYNFHWLMAAGMVAIIPMILIFFFAQRYFIEGIQMSGLKG